ncbi:MAG: hypothetical protein QW041_01575 [Candidatus Pacearchaeota archaeon]
MKDLIGKWAFVIGVIVAIVFGLLSSINELIATMLVLIGLIVGLLNITSKEATPFLLAGISLLIATSFGKDAIAVIPTIANVLTAIMILVVPAVIIVALREVFAIAKAK